MEPDRVFPMQLHLDLGQCCAKLGHWSSNTYWRLQGQCEQTPKPWALFWASALPVWHKKSCSSGGKGSAGGRRASLWTIVNGLNQWSVPWGQHSSYVWRFGSSSPEGPNDIQPACSRQESSIKELHSGVEQDGTVWQNSQHVDWQAGGRQSSSLGTPKGLQWRILHGAIGSHAFIYHFNYFNLLIFALWIPFVFCLIHDYILNMQAQIKTVK